MPKGTPREQAVSAYNEGVALMLDKHYAAAQEKFEQALGLDETLAEAHNNLAFSLRHAGAAQLRRSLQHYNRALELKPDLARAYMYRGALFIQMGDMTRARTDQASSCGWTRRWPPGSNASSPAPTDVTPMTTWQGRRRESSPKRLTCQRDRPQGQLMVASIGKRGCQRRDEPDRGCQPRGSPRRWDP